MNEVLVIAGEKSGEEHFLTFYDDLILKNPNTRFFGVGGREMKSKGIECIYDIDTFSTMGFTEAIKKLPFYFRAMKNILRIVELRKAKIAILVDFQDFNLRLAEKLNRRGVKVLYYVAPQAWVWRPQRVKKLSKFVDLLFTILPFEKKWFSDRGVGQIVGCQHPVFKKFSENKVNFHFGGTKNIDLLFLPGSRNSEVKSLLPTYYKVMKILKKNNPQLKFGIVLSDSVSIHINDNILDFDEVFTNEQLDFALSRTRFCLAASGTVTLSCAFHLVPTIVCYKTDRFNNFIARDVVGYNGFVCLVNIIAQKEVYPEILQDEFNEKNVLFYLNDFFSNEEKMQKIKNELVNVYSQFEEGEVRPGIIMGEIIAKSI